MGCLSVFVLIALVAVGLQALGVQEDAAWGAPMVAAALLWMISEIMKTFDRHP